MNSSRVYTPGAGSADTALTGYVYGLEFTYLSATQVQFDAGIARDDADMSFIELAAPVVLDITLSGAGGLDTGAPANDTWYAAWLIGGAAVPTSAVLVAGTAAPTLPAGYTCQRYIGATYRRADGTFRPFVCHGKSIRRSYEYNDSSGTDLIIYSGGGVVGSWQTMSAAEYLPRTATRVWLTVFTSGITYVTVSTPGTSSPHTDSPNIVHLGPIFVTAAPNGDIRRREGTSGNFVAYHVAAWEEDI